MALPLFAAAVFFFPAVADACPMCKAAAEADDRLPRAFFASILFMLAMPALLSTGFAVAFWRLSKRGEAENENFGAAGDGDEHLL